MHFLFNKGEKSQSLHKTLYTSKTGLTNYLPQPNYAWALSKIEGKGKLVKTKCLKISGSMKISESLKNSQSLKLSERILRFTMHRT